jgi:nitrate/nitrite transport system substrate-binding protein
MCGRTIGWRRGSQVSLLETDDASVRGGTTIDTTRFRLARRQLLRRAGLVGLGLTGTGVLAACGGAPLATPVRSVEPTAAPTAAPAAKPATSTGASTGPIKIGFIPLTDCASVVMASELGLYKKEGVDVEVTREASWANVRDKLVTGELQAAHCLFGMPFSVYTGVGGTAGTELPIAMVLNNNGQAITLAKDPFCGSVGYNDPSQVAKVVEAAKAKGRTPTFAMTFPGGTHDLWIRYWLGTAKVDQSTVKIITIPPPQMVANMKVGNMDAFCVGEPWNGLAVREGIGYTHVTTQDLWKHHPEKALVLNKEFHDKRLPEVKAVMRAVIEASKWLDDPANRGKAAATIGGQAYVNAPADVVEARLMGQYDLGCDLGKKSYAEDTMTFFNNGIVNAPRTGHGVFFLSQYVRWGYLKEPPDYQKIASTLVKSDLYREVAKDKGVAVPDDDMKPFKIDLDGVTFDPANPAAALKTWGGA